MVGTNMLLTARCVDADVPESYATFCWINGSFRFRPPRRPPGTVTYCPSWSISDLLSYIRDREKEIDAFIFDGLFTDDDELFYIKFRLNTPEGTSEVMETEHAHDTMVPIVNLIELVYKHEEKLEEMEEMTYGAAPGKRKAPRKKKEKPHYDIPRHEGDPDVFTSIT